MQRLLKDLCRFQRKRKQFGIKKESTAGAEQKANTALNSAKDYVDTIGEGTVIFKGANLMGAGQSFKWDASKLKFGMTLLFSRYDAANNTPQDYYYHSVFLSKAQLVELAGKGILVQMPSTTYGDRKYLYVQQLGYLDILIIRIMRLGLFAK